MEEDQKKGLEQTLGYLFFPQSVCCIPLFELMALRKWDTVIDKAALMNAVWKDFPEYAAAYNAAEQSGRHDMPGNLFCMEEEDTDLHRSLDHMISITPGAGIKFFKFL